MFPQNRKPILEKIIERQRIKYRYSKLTSKCVVNINWYLVWWKKYWEVSGESIILAFPLVIIVFIWPYRSFSQAKMLQTGIFNHFLLSSLLHYLFVFHLICIIYTEFSIISVTPHFLKDQPLPLSMSKMKRQ